MKQPDLEVKEFFDILASTSSKLAKKQLLFEKRSDQNVKRFLDYLLNPFFVTGISEKKIARPAVREPSVHFETFHELMSYIRENHTGSDEVLANVKAFLEGTDEELREFYIGIITKTIRIGCDVKTVNEGLGFSLIPQWEVQQAHKINKMRMNENEWFSLSQKLNGVRGTFFEGKIISRQGKEITGLDHILADLRVLCEAEDDWVFDGELIRKNTDGISDNENFRLSTGILNQEEGDKNSIEFVIFDVLPKSEFMAGESKQRYPERLRELITIQNLIEADQLSSIRVVDILYSGTDVSMIDYYLEQMVREGKEGLMLNRNCKYYRRRHNGILKVKRFYTVDLEIIGFTEGVGRLKNSLGAFVVRYKGHPLKIGYGLTDEQRRIFWEDRENLIGRVIEISYKDESRDKQTGHLSLQFAGFVRLREEGKQESYD